MVQDSSATFSTTMEELTMDIVFGLDRLSCRCIVCGPLRRRIRAYVLPLIRDFFFLYLFASEQG